VVKTQFFFNNDAFCNEIKLCKEKNYNFEIKWVMANAKMDHLVHLVINYNNASLAMRCQIIVTIWILKNLIFV